MIGQRLAGRYEILAELGRGGMGVVYRARDPKLNREVAVKVIAPNLLTPETEQRFKTEAQVVARLDHPSIVSIHDFGQHEGSLFFVMPVVEGVSLRQLPRQKPLVLGEILDIAIQVGEVLEYSHGHGIVHRDIKPENIMVARTAGVGVRTRVMDFGLARASEVTGLTKTGVLVGTMSYISPEQASGRAVDIRSDIYALGTVLYEAVTGEVPFSGDMQAVLYRVVHEIPQSPRERGGQIDEELDRIITWCLAKDPAERPQTPADLVQALRKYRSGLRDGDQNRSIMVTRMAQAPRAALAPFVGRKGEFRELQQRLNAAVAGECQLVMVAGDAGVGKTRLLDEIEKIAQARQIRVLHGRFMEQGGAFPYHGFCEAIQEYFRQKETASTPSGEIDFSDLGPELIGLFPMLGEIDAIRSGSSPGSGAGSQPGSTDESRRPENQTQIFELLARTFIRLAAGKPLVLILEDLHGAEVSIDALRYIARRLGPTPTLIAGTYRSSEVDRRSPISSMIESFQGDRHFARIDLKPFTSSDHRDLISTLVGGARFSDELARRLFEGTEGNPFFTKELVRSLMDSGGMVRDDTGIWSLSGRTEIASEALPATIQQAVERRIARLPEALRGVLSTAAVMGKTFDFRDLEALADEGVDLEDAIDRLIQEGLIEEERQSRGDTLTFSSAVVREVLYAELSRRKRRSLHRTYAARLEERHAGKLDRVYPQLVHHYSEGDVPEKSVEFGLKHARRSLDAFSPEEAIRSAKTALEFLDEEWEGDPGLEAEGRMILASAHQVAGDVDAALREIGAAAKIFERAGETERLLEALLSAARAAWQSRRPEEARAWVERGMSAARAAGSDARLAAFLSLAATLANLRGEYEKGSALLQEAERLGGEARGEAAGPALAEGGTLTVALANAVLATDLASMETQEEWEVFTNVIETLVTTGEEGDTVPHLCERWEVHDEGRSFFFTLRSGVRFQDGAPLTAAEVKAAMERTVKAVKAELPPAFAPLRGVAAFQSGDASGISGIVAASDQRLEIHLEDPLPIYPVLLADARAGIHRPSAGAGGYLIGTGPFRMVGKDGTVIRLERHADYWKGAPAHIESLVFRHAMSAARVATDLESGSVDVAGDLLPADLERLASHPRFRRGLAERSKRNTYFAVFTSHDGSAVRDERIRLALSGVIRTHDLVWKTLGRFAQPAVGLIPPGMIGHDPGRRPRLLGMEEARSMLAEAGVASGLTLKAAVHPVVADRYASLLKAIIQAWKELGVEVEVATTDIASFLEALGKGGDYDLAFMRWNADYNDPDNFTHSLFHSETGQFRTWYASREADVILDAARRVTLPGSREAQYRRFESLVLGPGIILPLFHELEYRLSGPEVSGLKVRGTYPVVNYVELARAAGGPVREGAAVLEGGVLQIPMGGAVNQLDPATLDLVEETETLSSIYETLVRINEGRVEPLLAAQIRAEEGGRRYRFRLREGMRFHDGRRVTARDVRYSFERPLQTDSLRHSRFAMIQGAAEVLAGKTRELSGFHIHSSLEFTIDLTEPLAFFPVLLSDHVASVLPEGTPLRIGRSQKEGAVGTGPYRLVRFEPGRTLELERNPHYWREGYPRTQRLVFHLGLDSKEILDGFKAGRYSLAADLAPADVEALRRDPAYASGYREAPSLSTYFIMFNRNRGPFTEAALRHRVAQAVNAESLVRQSLGRGAIPAHGFIPPGLLGHEATPEARRERSSSSEETPTTGGELLAGVHPIFNGEYAALYRLLEQSLRDAGFVLRIGNADVKEYIEGWRSGRFDLMVGRWMADYPDTDTFAQFLNSSSAASAHYVGLEELDRIVVKARVEMNPAARHALYRQVEEILRREALMIPLFHEQVYRFARPEVDNLSVSYTSPAVAYETLRVRQR